MQLQSTLPGFERTCRAEGGEYLPPSTSYGIGPVPLPAGCGFGRAKDANRLCSNAEQPEAGNTCGGCQYSATCGPAAGDFGPMQCHCGVFKRLLRFQNPANSVVDQRGTIELSPAVMLSGTFEPEVLQAFLRARRQALAFCYERSLRRNPSLRGRVDLAFTIQSSARASDIEVKAPDGFSKDELSTCLKVVVRGWVFPRKPEEPVSVQVSMVFSPAS